MRYRPGPERRLGYRLASKIEVGIQSGNVRALDIEISHRERRRLIRDLNKQIIGTPPGPERDYLLREKQSLEASQFATRIALASTPRY